MAEKKDICDLTKFLEELCEVETKYQKANQKEEEIDLYSCFFKKIRESAKNFCINLKIHTKAGNEIKGLIYDITPTVLILCEYDEVSDDSTDNMPYNPKTIFPCNLQFIPLTSIDCIDYETD